MIPTAIREIKKRGRQFEITNEDLNEQIFPLGLVASVVGDAKTGTDLKTGDLKSGAAEKSHIAQRSLNVKK